MSSSAALKISNENSQGAKMVNGVAGDRLLSLIRKIEALESQKSEIADEIKGVYGEAKSSGFDIKIIRKIVTIRKREKAEVDEEMMLLDVYMQAIGMGVED